MFQKVCTVGTFFGRGCGSKFIVTVQSNNSDIKQWCSVVSLWLLHACFIPLHLCTPPFKFYLFSCSVLFRPVGSSRRVERPSVVTSEAAQRPRVSREARKKIATYFYGGKEAALAASRYIEGHALTLRKKNSIQAEIKHTAS